VIELIGKRSTLQIALFIVSVAVMIPHSKLYTRDSKAIAGRGTLLYALVGPGNEDFEIEEMIADVTVLDQKETPAWKEGSVSAISPSTVGVEVKKETQEISTISAGGTALTKPTILPGTVLPSSEEASAVGRTEIVTHIVQSGEIIGKIAAQYGISIETILWANNLSVRSYIRPGDQLKILPANGVVHKVKSGETVSQIARVYGANQDDIVKFNKLKKDGSDIVVGEELIIPGGKKEKPKILYTSTASSKFRNVAAPPPSISAPAGSGYLWPTTVRRITQYFGWRHTGIDIAGPVGTPIYASLAGEVIKSGCGWNGGYGCYIIIDHGGGVRTLYGHNSQLYVSAGDSVSQGDTIAAMGSTGRSTGSHVHFEVIVSGGKQNPLRYVR